jgi:tight adherence protein B
MMIPLAFMFMLLLVFGILLVTMRATPEQKAVSSRLASIRATTGQGGASSAEQDGLLKAEASGNFDWIEDLLERFSITQKMQSLILQANSTTTFGTMIVISFVLGLVGSFVTFIFLPVLAVAAGVAVALSFIPFAVLMFKRKRRIDAFNRILPEAIDMMARSLRAGHSMVAAISIVAEHAAEPVGSEFGEVFRKQNFGLPLRDALTQLLERIPSQDLRVVVTGILVQKDTGGNLAEILDRTVKVIRERLRIQGEIKTHTAQGRLTGWILCGLPVIMLVLINMINPGYSNVLFEPGFGRTLLYVGIVLLIAGGLIIRQIVNGIEV